MVGSVVFVAVAAVGVQVGWERNDRGEIEYIIQIEPEELKTWAASGQKVLYSDVRPELRDVRTYRLQIGAGPLPRVPLVQDDAPAKVETSAKEPSGAASAGGAAPPRGSPSDQGDTQPAPLPPQAAPSRALVEKPAVYEVPIGSGGAAPGEPVSTSPEASQADRVPLLVTSATAVGLFAALVYLGWVHVGVRNRYRALLAEYLARVGEPGGEVRPQEACIGQ